MLECGMQLNAHEIHVWSVKLAVPAEQLDEKLSLLSTDEVTQANRFRQPLHRERYIASRAALREILSLYLDVHAQEIGFAYTEHRKPYIATPHARIQFNLAHSENQGVYALTLNHAIGVDIEKIRNTFTEGVLKRFFTKQEQRALQPLSDDEKNLAFYRVWSRKEAIIKAIGKGFAIPLSTFSVAVKDVSETLVLEDETWTLVPLTIHPDFQSALATNQIIQSLSYWRFSKSGPEKVFPQPQEDSL